MKLSYDLTIEQTQKLSMTPELIQAIQILQFNNMELDSFVENELLENPILEVGKQKETDKDEPSDMGYEEPISEKNEEKEIDLREKIKEAEYDDISYKQWEYKSTPDDEYTFEQFVSKETTLDDYMM
ncbi:MAG: hypothetical protein RR769_06645, partial [Anaerovoracaceae bacterium]